MCLVPENVAQIDVSHGVAGLKLQCSPIGAAGVIELALAFEVDAKVIPGVREIGLEVDGSLVTKNRVIELALPLEGQAEVVPRSRDVRIELHGLPIAADRVV